MVTRSALRAPEICPGRLSTLFLPANQSVRDQCDAGKEIAKVGLMSTGSLAICMQIAPQVCPRGLPAGSSAQAPNDGRLATNDRTPERMDCQRGITIRQLMYRKCGRGSRKLKASEEGSADHRLMNSYRCRHEKACRCDCAKSFRTFRFPISSDDITRMQE